MLQETCLRFYLPDRYGFKLFLEMVLKGRGLQLAGHCLKTITPELVQN